MARKIKFSLEMNSGVQVRNLEELRENFDLEKTLNYYINGRLLTWLKDRYYESEAAQIAELDSNDKNIKEKICNILGVDCADLQSIDINKLEERAKRISKLKKYTDDEDIIQNIDSVAFNQEELNRLVHCGITLIYLCGKEFTISIDTENISYKGMLRPIINIEAKTDVDLDEKNINIENCILKCDFPINILALNSKGIICEGKIKCKDNYSGLKSENKWIIGIKERKVYEKKPHEFSLSNGEYNGKKYIQAKNLYRSKIDGSSEEFITEDTSDVLEFCVHENIIFYALNEGCGNATICKIDVSGDNSKKLNIRYNFNKYGSYIKSIFCNDKWIIWSSIHEECYGSDIYKARYDGSDKERLVSNYEGSIRINEVLENYISYTINWGGCLYRFDLIDNSNIQIDYHVLGVDSDGENLYYLKQKLGKAGLGEQQLCFYRTNIYGGEKILLEHHYSYDFVTRLKYKDGVLYYYTKKELSMGGMFLGGDVPEIENKIIINK